MSDTEALKVAMNTEEEGLRFYEGMARKVESEDARRLFTDLADSEKEHFRTFSGLHDKISGDSSPVSWTLDEDQRQYLRGLVDTGVFSGLPAMRGAGNGGLTEREALAIGIQAEKDSILFYREAAEVSHNASGRKAFALVVEEEKKHLADLSERLRQLADEDAG